MNLLDTILNAQGGGVVQQLADRFGLDQGAATSAIQSLLPGLTAGLQQNATQPGGLEALLGALTQGNHQRYLENPATLAHPAAAEDGKAILGHVLGTPDASRALAGQAATQTGLDPAVLKQMLPVVASLAMAALSRHASSGTGQPTQGGLMGLLAPMSSGSGGVLGALGKLLG